jgi:exodeoxyribonuclease VII large subunit
MIDLLNIEQYDKTSAYTLSQLNSFIREVIELTFPQTLWVIAEISEAQRHPKGHCYLELVERKDGKTIAQMRANIWAYTYRSLAQKFEEVTGETLKKGMKILLLVNVTFHEVYGLSLNVKDIDPTFYLGEMAKKRKEVIELLTQKGIINLNKALPLPLVPQRIAIISSSTAAGYGDFITHLEQNPYGYKVYCELYQSSMQGVEAEKSIISSLNGIKKRIKLYDAVVIIRGGGSQVDLSCFDSYALASEVAKFPLPVITGIGHERDDTVVDMVAHTKRKTPTAVAEFIISGMRTFEERVLEARSKLIHRVNEQVRKENHRVRFVAQRLTSLVSKTFHNEHNRLHNGIHSLIQGANNLLNAAGNKTKLSFNKIRSGVELLLQSQETKLKQFEQAVRLLDPINTLKRGYSITYYKNKALKDAIEVKAGELIATKLYSGLIISKVEGRNGKESFELYNGNC